ncbi:hypothetical protein HPB50_004432 [Hyalomma asiaticum]|uniref:Uncharacterized protein n=1 Tax=Hyalomma asiaticum TaxID=266040 RepID=A0ACB7TCW7_HYAAI|nr:hypothetical protein HPB50_004432 [Hyalomma asiaticum]
MGFSHDDPPFESGRRCGRHPITAHQEGESRLGCHSGAGSARANLRARPPFGRKRLLTLPFCGRCAGLRFVCSLVRQGAWTRLALIGTADGSDRKSDQEGVLMEQRPESQHQDVLSGVPLLRAAASPLHRGMLDAANLSCATWHVEAAGEGPIASLKGRGGEHRRRRSHPVFESRGRGDARRDVRYKGRIVGACARSSAAWPDTLPAAAEFVTRGGGSSTSHLRDSVYRTVLHRARTYGVGPVPSREARAPLTSGTGEVPPEKQYYPVRQGSPTDEVSLIHRPIIRSIKRLLALVIYCFGCPTVRQDLHGDFCVVYGFAKCSGLSRLFFPARFINSSESPPVALSDELRSTHAVRLRPGLRPAVCCRTRSGLRRGTVVLIRSSSALRQNGDSGKALLLPAVLRLGVAGRFGEKTRGELGKKIKKRTLRTIRAFPLLPCSVEQETAPRDPAHL